MNLQNRITRGLPITQQEQEYLSALLSSRTRQATREALKRRLATPTPLWPNYGIYSRVGLDPVEYTAGQDYTAEIALIRQLILKG